MKEGTGNMICHMERVHTLEEWGAPPEGWECAGVFDAREYAPDAPLGTCCLCGRRDVRFVHCMEHPDYFERLAVCRACAGAMEGDAGGARERERRARDRAGRKRLFAGRKWAESPRGVFRLEYRGRDLLIVKSGERYRAYVGNAGMGIFMGSPITDMRTAARAAFELADPPEGAGRP